MLLLRRAFYLALGTVALVGCSDDGASPSGRFLDGTPDNAQIGLVVNSTGKALTLFQLGDPTEIEQIPFGASSAVTPTGLALRGTRAAVGLGNAASVALVDLDGARIERFFTFPNGNITGVAFADDNTLLAANLIGNYVGRVTLDQVSTQITNTVDVSPAPTAIVMAGNRALVLSGNLDENYTPLGNGIVTAIDPVTLAPLDTVETGGTNPTSAALGPDGKLYVVNTEDYVAEGSVTVIDPATLTVEDTYNGFGAGPGAIKIDANGLAYISSFFNGTIVWNTATHAFVRGPADPVCARRTLVEGTPCRGAFDAARDETGKVYQAFFGSAGQSLPPYIFVYSPTYELVDSISAGVGPASIDIAKFRN